MRGTCVAALESCIPAVSGTKNVLQLLKIIGLGVALLFQIGSPGCCEFGARKGVVGHDKKKAFQRARDSLVTKGLIEVNNNYYSIRDCGT